MSTAASLSYSSFRPCVRHSLVYLPEVCATLCLCLSATWSSATCSARADCDVAKTLCDRDRAHTCAYAQQDGRSCNCVSKCVRVRARTHGHECESVCVIMVTPRTRTTSRHTPERAQSLKRCIVQTTKRDRHLPNRTPVSPSHPGKSSGTCGAVRQPGPPALRVPACDASAMSSHQVRDCYLDPVKRLEGRPSRERAPPA